MSDNHDSPALSKTSQEVEQYEITHSSKDPSQQDFDSQSPSSEFPSTTTSSVEDANQILEAIRMKTSFKTKAGDTTSRASGGTITTLERHLKYAGDDDDDDDDGSQEGEKKLRFGESGSAKDVVQPPESKGMRFAFGKSPTTCERFLGVVKFAEIFVDNLLEEAILKRLDRKRLSAIKVFEGIEYTEQSDSLSDSSIATYVCIFDWPTIEEFNVECGISKIDEYLSFWKFEEDWKYCINFLQGESDQACDFYHYEYSLQAIPHSAGYS